MSEVITQRLVCNTEWVVSIKRRYSDDEVVSTTLERLGHVNEVATGYRVPAELWSQFERFYAEYQEEEAYNESLRQEAMRPYRVEAGTGDLDRAATEREYRESMGA